VRAEPDLNAKGETAVVPFHSPDPVPAGGFDHAAPPLRDSANRNVLTAFLFPTSVRSRNEHRRFRVVAPRCRTIASASMDILAGVFAYVAGIGALFAALALSFFVFFAAPPGAAVAPPSATAMVVKPVASNRSLPAATSPQATRHEKHSPAVAAAPSAARPGTKDIHRKPAMAATRLRVQEERDRRWADQQNSRFDNRLLGYAE
jgi:hypothetical protein